MSEDGGDLHKQRWARQEHWEMRKSEGTFVGKPGAGSRGMLRLESGTEDPKAGGGAAGPWMGMVAADPAGRWA